LSHRGDDCRHSNKTTAYKTEPHNIIYIHTCEYYEVSLPNQASSSQACEILLKSFLPTTPFYDSLVCLDKSVLNVNKLLPLLSSTNERPDVTIYHNDKLVFLAEIDSSSDGNFETAVQKTIIGAIIFEKSYKYRILQY
jgi:hypothetical protein